MKEAFIVVLYKAKICANLHPSPYLGLNKMSSLILSFMQNSFVHLICSVKYIRFVQGCCFAGNKEENHNRSALHFLQMAMRMHKCLTYWEQTGFL